MIDQQTTSATRLPMISEVFSDPYDPDKSFWIHAEMGKDLKSCFIEADQLLAEGSFRKAKKPVETIAAQLPQSVRDRFLRRLVYNYYYLCPYEPRLQKLELPPQLKAEYAAGHSASRSVVENIQVPPALEPLVLRTRGEMRNVYGTDLVKSGVSIRYADHRSPSPYKCDNANDVDEQLLSVMHFDEKKGITSIVYLTDVKETNGCFSYLEGSNRIRQSLSIRTFHETLTDDLRLKTADEARNAGVPENLFGTLAYGENLPSEKREVAKRYVKKLVGPAGTSISFTGNTLIHGGGWPVEGHRIAVFIDHVGLVGHRAKYLIPYYWHFRIAA